MKKRVLDWSIIGLTQEEKKVSIDAAEYFVDASTAAICHAILVLAEQVNKYQGCKYGKEMDSESNKASRCSAQGAGCCRGQENSRKETSCCF